MKTPLFLIAIALPLWAQQSFDFKSLDKLDAIAKNKTKITLDEDMLKLAMNFLDSSKTDKHPDSLRRLTQDLKGIYVRTYEFDKRGQYSEADLEPLRAYLKQQHWSRIVESQEENEKSDIYILPLPNERCGGVAIISEEARELTVVYINGSMNLSDLEKLGGNLGIPEIDLKPRKTPQKRQEQQEHQNQ